MLLYNNRARFWALAGISPSPEAMEERLRGGRAALKAAWLGRVAEQPGHVPMDA